MELDSPIFEHEHWMRRCLLLAKRGWGKVSPNPMVGSVLVRNGRALAEGWHDVFGGPHAERMLFDGWDDGSDLSDCILYVSLEPCSHFGKTPPCANLILEKGVGTVVVGVLDPNPQVSGRGVELLRSSGVEVVVGILEEECRQLNWSFWVNQRLGRAAVMAKWAETSDGFMGSGTLDRVKISGEASGLWVMKMRAGMDAILVGANTWKLDRPRLNVRGKVVMDGLEIDYKQPVRIVLDRSGSGEVYEENVKDGVGLLWVLDGFSEVRTLLEWLYMEKGIGVVMVEGGAKVLEAFFKEDCVDRVDVLRNEGMMLGDGVKSPSIGVGMELKQMGNMGADEHWFWERALK
jgi:diaminohydroxyphosphoribosylaminopyrimidine deaminase/5-amino-6-(5-phosphoribosylamino)uracil reductase